MYIQKKEDKEDFFLFTDTLQSRRIKNASIKIVFFALHANKTIPMFYLTWWSAAITFPSINLCSQWSWFIVSSLHWALMTELVNWTSQCTSLTDWKTMCSKLPFSAICATNRTYRHCPMENYGLDVRIEHHVVCAFFEHIIQKKERFSL